MMVIISLGYICVGRKRSRCPAASKEWCQFGANCCQKSSTEQNSSSILIAEPPEDKHWFSSLLYLIRYGSLSRTHVIYSSFAEKPSAANLCAVNLFSCICVINWNTCTTCS